MDQENNTTLDGKMNHILRPWALALRCLADRAWGKPIGTQLRQKYHVEFSVK